MSNNLKVSTLNMAFAIQNLFTTVKPYLSSLHRLGISNFNTGFHLTTCLKSYFCSQKMVFFSTPHLFYNSGSSSKLFITLVGHGEAIAMNRLPSQYKIRHYSSLISLGCAVVPLVLLLESKVRFCAIWYYLNRYRQRVGSSTNFNFTLLRAYQAPFSNSF